MNEIPHEDIVILGTRAMLLKHCDKLALEYCYIENYVLNPITKCKWVRQMILLGYKGCCKVIPSKDYEYNRPEQPNEIRFDFNSVGGGRLSESLNCLFTRSRKSSKMLSLSDEDFRYIKEHWYDMSYVERFWWLHDHGLYKQFLPIQEEK